MKVLILPGLDGTGIMLEEFSARLRTRLEVQVIEYPKDVRLNYAELASLVIGQLPRDEPYSIIAESFSGPIAAIVASTSFKGLRSLIFAASFLRKPTSIPKIAINLTKYLPLHSTMLLRLAEPFTFGQWGSRSQSESLAASVRAVSIDVLAYRLRLVTEVDELDSFSKIDVPVFYIQPTYDKLVSSKAFLDMRSANRSLEKILVEGPHFILQAKPDECAARVIDCLNDLPDQLAR